MSGAPFTSAGPDASPADGDDRTKSQGPALDKPAPCGSSRIHAQAARPDQAPVSNDDKTVISQRPLASDELPPLAPGPEQIGALLIGKRLEHYQLDEYVGGGGMGAVFRATDTRLGRVVAVKVLLRDRSDEETIRRFQNEAQNAARLDHPNIARVYYVGEDRGWNFIVFEFIEGTNLRDAVDQRGPLTLADALYYTLQVAEAIDHSSSRDVVHRDIKPSNVLLTADNQIKLVDMGLARLHQVAQASEDLTASGVTLGTFDYISPEQARDPRSADVRSDIYSLGCTLYYMLTGQPPFPDGTALQKLIRHSSDEPADVQALRPELPPQVGALVANMLAKRPAQRPQDAQELIRQIVAIGSELGLENLVPRITPLRSPQPSRSQSRDTAWQILVAVAVLVAAVVVLDAIPARRPMGGDSLPAPRFAPSAASERSAGSTAVASSVQVDGGERQAAQSNAASRNVNSNSGPGDVSPALPMTASVVAQQPAPDLEQAEGASLSLPLLEAAAGADQLEAEVSAAPALPGGTPDAAARPRRIVVAPGSVPADADTEYVASLSEAVRRAAAAGQSEIELRFSGRWIEQPLEIAAPRLALRAAPGFRPVLVFQPTAAERQMIQLAGGSSARLHVQGVELRLELPVEPSAGWSLLALGTGQSLELTDCILTVQDGDDDRPPIHEQAAMISIQSRRASETMALLDSQPMMSQSAGITLERCLARGEASLLVLPEDVPVALRWNQGLLVTTRRLLETGGSAADPKWFEKIDLSLESVTAVCEQGLHRMQRGPGKGYQLPLDVTAQRCILSTGPATSLYEFVGLPAGSEEDLRLQYTGDANCYPHADVVFLRIHSGAAGDRPRDFELDDRRWSIENRSQVGNPWLHQPSRHLPAHAATKADYLADIELTLGAGFDSQQLPEPTSNPPSIPAAPPAVQTP